MTPDSTLAVPPPQSPRFRRDLPSLERRAGAWLRDFQSVANQPNFSISSHLAELAAPEPLGRDRRRIRATIL